MRHIVPPVCFFALVLLTWQLYVWAFDVPRYILPEPHVVLDEVITDRGQFVRHARVTAVEASAGFVLGSCLAILIAIVFVYFPVIQKGAYPYAIALKTMPVIALAPLLTVWFGTGLTSKIVIAMIVTFFPVLVNTAKGLEAYDRDMGALFQSLSASRIQELVWLRVPSSLPYIFSGLKVGSSMAVLGALVGELAGSNQGLGFLILISSYQLQTTQMFGAMVMAGLIGVGFFGVVAFVEHRVVHWSGPRAID